jgi:hypothetical protein
VIYDLIDKRNKATEKRELPLSSYVKQLERMLDEGFVME